MSFVTFWTNHGSEVANGALVLSAIAAFAIIRSGRNVARRRGTLDLILHIESDRELIEAREKFIDLKVGSAKLDNFGMESERKSENAKTIRKVLNVHEITAVAIQEGVIDERVFRRWFNKAFIEDHNSCAGYIDQIRKARGNDAIFKEFRVLAERWENDKYFYAAPSWLRRKWWAAQRIWWA